jgi:CRP-like cAMP-binding protein
MSLKECTQNPSDCDLCSTKEQNPICSSKEALELISKIRTTSRYKADQTIFYAGNDPLGIFTVQSGLVKLEVVSVKGTAHTLRLMGPGSIIGYRSLFANEPYHASAIAVEDSELCFLPKDGILRLTKENPQVALNLMSYLAKDLRAAEEKWVYQIDKDAPERVAEALLFLHEHFLGQDWTRREIAEWAGTTPETVMRTLSQFEKNGWISTSGRVIHITNREKIKEKAQA